MHCRGSIIAHVVNYQMPDISEDEIDYTGKSDVIATLIVDRGDVRTPCRVLDSPDERLSGQ